MNLPTKITFTRIICIILMIITLFVLELIPGFTSPMLGNTGINLVYLILCIFFIVASFTDFLDGYLARKNNQVTDLGKFLDPVADKLLVNSMVIFLIFTPNFLGTDSTQITFNVFCAIILVARDIVVDALRFIAAQKRIVIAANIFGKLKTVLQMIAIPLVLLNDFPFRYIYGDSCPQYLTVTSFVVYLATLVSLVSGIIYVVQNKKVLKN